MHFLFIFSSSAGSMEILELQEEGRLAPSANRPRLIREGGASAEPKHQPRFTESANGFHPTGDNAATLSTKQPSGPDLGVATKLEEGQSHKS